MSDFSLVENYTKNLEKLMRRTSPLIVPPSVLLIAQESVTKAPSTLKAMAKKTIRDFSIPSTTNVATRSTWGA